MQQYVIIVAGGKGQRMGMDLPKQFIDIAGRPVMMHTINAFYNYNNEIKIVVAVEAGSIKLWGDLCRAYHFDIQHTVVAGGDTRFQSVKNGLMAVGDEGFVAIHDAVRPLIEKKLIAEAFSRAEIYLAAVPVVPVHDTIRNIIGDSATALERNDLRIVQTPQVFDINLIREAYRQPYDDSFTDDAEVLQATGARIHYFDGQASNIKITRKENLEVVDVLLKSKLGSMN